MSNKYDNCILMGNVKSNSFTSQNSYGSDFKAEDFGNGEIICNEEVGNFIQEKIVFRQTVPISNLFLTEIENKDRFTFRYR